MKTILKRLKCNTPVFFKKLRTWLIAISTGIIGMGTTLVSIPTLPDFIKKIGGVLITIGVVAGALGSFLTSLPMDIASETKEEAKTEVKEEIKDSLDK